MSTVAFPPIEEKFDGRFVLGRKNNAALTAGTFGWALAEIALTAPRLRAAVRKISLLTIKCVDATSFAVLKLDCFKQSSCERWFSGRG